MPKALSRIKARICDPESFDVSSTGTRRSQGLDAPTQPCPERAESQARIAATSCQHHGQQQDPRRRPGHHHRSRPTTTII